MEDADALASRLRVCWPSPLATKSLHFMRKKVLPVLPPEAVDGGGSGGSDAARAPRLSEAVGDTMGPEKWVGDLVACGEEGRSNFSE